MRTTCFLREQYRTRSSSSECVIVSHSREKSEQYYGERKEHSKRNMRVSLMSSEQLGGCITPGMSMMTSNYPIIPHGERRKASECFNIQFATRMATIDESRAVFIGKSLKSTDSYVWSHSKATITEVISYDY